jgi:hypothetical protein
VAVQSKMRSRQQSATTAQISASFFMRRPPNPIGTQIGSRAERRSARLAWDQLVQIYGTEEILRERIKELRGSALANDESLLDLVDKCARGWRQKQFEFDED